MQLNLEEIAALCKCTLEGDPKKIIQGASTVESANENEASFISNPKYTSFLKTTEAGVVFISDSAKRVEGKNYLVSKDPSKAFQILLEHLYLEEKSVSAFEGIHSSAVIHPEAKIGKNVSIGPNAVVDANTEINDNCIIGPGSYIGRDCVIGEKTMLHANVTVRELVSLGKRVIIQPGAVIGSCGFGYILDENYRFKKLSHVGHVIIEDDVEIGANTTIDRGRVGDTIIKKGTKVDNLVQVAHAVEIGENNLLVAQSGFAGSSKTGAYVTAAGQSAVGGHISIASGVTLAARTGVVKSIGEKGKYGGFPAKNIDKFRRQQVLMDRLEEKFKQVKQLEKKLQQFEEMMKKNQK
ncbi:UDP-3-O-acylglucosamine N-acyltransferase [Chlamydiales bacterium SCGC AB-751-O23]|jgi:UDP-3-O-[3-hydroxymyristoyl] glucosamine N-acyltransferase|nr:UDP-3-O-acylglucosamine N-acyltransferase [Chlamydiales bacterium SCGC AB-751-O23]